MFSFEKFTWYFHWGHHITMSLACNNMSCAMSRRSNIYNLCSWSEYSETKSYKGKNKPLKRNSFH